MPLESGPFFLSSPPPLAEFCLDHCSSLLTDSSASGFPWSHLPPPEGGILPKHKLDDVILPLRPCSITMCTELMTTPELSCLVCHDPSLPSHSPLLVPFVWQSSSALIEDGDHVFYPLHEIGPCLWQAFNEHLSNGIKSGQGLCQFLCTVYTVAHGSCQLLCTQNCAEWLFTCISSSPYYLTVTV